MLGQSIRGSASACFISEQPGPVINGKGSSKAFAMR